MIENEIIDGLRIIDLLDDGRAFGRHGGCAVFISPASGSDVKSVVPGDLIKAKITKVKKSSAEGVFEEMIKASPDRIKADCPYFGECGG